MKLKICHRTVYSYSDPVLNNVNEVRLRPRESPWQRLEFQVIRVLPATRLTHDSDSYRNVVHRFEIPEPHSQMMVESEFRIVTTSKAAATGFPYGCSHASMVRCQAIEECADFLRDSRYAVASADIRRVAVDAQGDSTDVFQTCFAIMAYIFDNFRYQSGVTSISSTAEDVFRSREGVCQDFAHLMIAMCRSIGIPARYASGYLFDPGVDSGIRGAQASHAWCEVFIPESGWYGLDPTNNKVVDDSYVKLATGRDYNDTAPVIGQYLGRGGISLDVSVSVERL